MKKYILLVFTVLFVFISGYKVTAQNRCIRYHVLKCKFHDFDAFQYSGQSRSAEFYKGTTSKFKFNAMAGDDYHISICYNKELGDVQYKIMEDNDAKTLIYDNSTDNFAKDKVLTIKTDKTFIIEVTVPGDGTEIQPDSQRYCLGVLIEYMQTPKSGF